MEVSAFIPLSLRERAGCGCPSILPDLRPLTSRPSPHENRRHRHRLRRPGHGHLLRRQRQRRHLRRHQRARRSTPSKRGEIPIYEPGLAELVERNVDGRAAARSRPTWPRRSKPADIVFLAVGTPQRRRRRGRSLGPLGASSMASPRTCAPTPIVVTKSTVPVGTNAGISQRCSKSSPAATATSPAIPSSSRKARRSTTS